MLSITKLQNLKAIHNKIKNVSKFLVCCYQSQNYKIWKQFTTQIKLLPYLCTLLSITKLQNLKAIHNIWREYMCQLIVVINHKTTKFESNSQLNRISGIILVCCYQSQNYKIWKQFTTFISLFIVLWMLLSITKLQNLKAIHNRRFLLAQKNIVVINHKTTKFESNSQQTEECLMASGGCYQSQNYKIWKQFTTLYIAPH